MQKTQEIGNKYGLLTVLQENGKSKNGHIRYVCKCDCGTEKIFSINHLRNGNIQSCGCIKEFLKQKNRGNVPVIFDNKLIYIHTSIFNESIHKKTNIYDSISKEKNRNTRWKGCGEISGNFWNHVIRVSQASKKRKSMDFSITIEYAWDLFLKQDRKCALSGLFLKIPYLDKQNKRIGNASLDRIDSSLGYIEGNVQWVHKDINMMKRIYSQDYFIEMCTLVAENCKDT